MSPNTKSKVKYSRQVQLGLRLLELLGTLGILFCVIAIKGTSGTLGWIIRVAPGVALLHTLYAIYHLCRSSTGRTPASSASYMLFAAMIDVGLLPFLAFSAVMAYSEHTRGTYGWDTLFGEPLTTWYIVYSTFLLCVIEGGLLLVSLALGIYLAILFRKIAKLPPDMNPLEPNLTARPHKRNKSELTTSDKRMSQTTLASNNRMSSTADPLIAPGRRVPFMHTRTDSADSVTLYGNNSPRHSRLDLSKPANLYQQSNNSFRNSYTPLNKSLPNSPSRPQSATAPSNTTPQVRMNHDQPQRPPELSHLAHRNSSDWQTLLNQSSGRVFPLTSEIYPHQLTTTTGDRYYEQNSPVVNDENIPPPSEISPISSRASTPGPSSRNGTEYTEIKNWYESPHQIRNKKSASRDHYAPIQPAARESLYDFDRDLGSPSLALSPQQKKVIGNNEKQNPLGMNPPTPAPSLPGLEQQQQTEDTKPRRNSFEAGDEQSLQAQPDARENKRYALYDAPVNLLTRENSTPRPKLSSRPSSFVGSGSKGRYYGDLRGSVVGKRNSWGSSQSESESASNYSKGSAGSDASMTSEERGGQSRRTATTMESEDDAGDNVEVLGRDSDDDEEEYDDHRQRLYQKQMTLDRERVHTDDADRKGRVVSNTSRNLVHDFDLAGGYAGLGAEFGRGMGRRNVRREVSGKVVEEGRSGESLAFIDGRGGGGNGVARGEGGLKAAGWARFKGL